MVTNIDRHIPAGHAAERSPLLEQLARKADVNRDGAVSQNEFNAFLAALVTPQDAATEQPTARTAASPQETRLSGISAAPGAALEALRQAIAKSGGQ